MDPNITETTIAVIPIWLSFTGSAFALFPMETRNSLRLIYLHVNINLVQASHGFGENGGGDVEKSRRG
jgi:hypothetical protein